MKRASILVVSLVAALSLALLLVGCSSGEYTPEAKEQTVSNTALNSAGTLRVGVNASNAPYAAESSGSIVGIDVDIAAALADEMGLKLELVDVGTNASDAFEKENVDIVMGVDEANSAYWMSDSYLNSGIALFASSESEQAPTKSGSFKIAAQSASMSAWEVSDHYGDDCLENETDLQTAFTALQSGTVAYVAADSTIGEYVAHSSNIEAYPIALLQEPVAYSIAVSASNSALQEAVANALDTIDGGGIINVVKKKWLGDQTEAISLSVISSPSKSSDSGDSSDSNSDSSEDSSDNEDESSDSSESDSAASESSSSSSSETSDETSE